MTYEDYLGEPFRMWHNGFDYSEYFKVIEVTGRSLSPNEIQSLNVTGKNGSHIQSKRKPGVPLKVKVLLTTKSDFELRETIDELNGLLDSDKQVPIIFSDEPTKTYYGILSDISEGREVDGNHIVTITFFRGDPYKYGPEQQAIPFVNDALSIQNEGTAESYPTIEAIANQSVTSFMIAKGSEEFFMVGQPYDVDKQTIEQYPNVAFYPMESLVGWSPMTEGFFFDDEVSGGYVSNGIVEVLGGASFSPASFGTERPGWHGPAIRRSFPESIGDFQITFGTSLYSNGNGIGKVMALFLDENDKIVASVGLINTRRGTRNARVLVRMNDGQNIRRTRVMDFPGDSGPESTVFSGRPLNIQLTREGNRYIAKTWQVTDGVAHARHSEEIISDVVEFQRPIRQVVLFFAKYGSNPGLHMQAIGMRIRKNNTLLLDDTLIPYIAHAGDKILIDCKNEMVMINDELVTKLKAFGADYFALNPGDNQLLTFPEGAFSTSLKYSPAFK